MVAGSNYPLWIFSPCLRLCHPFDSTLETRWGKEFGRKICEGFNLTSFGRHGEERMEIKEREKEGRKEDRDRFAKEIEG